MKPAAKARRTMLMLEIPRDELALRIAERCLGMKAPAGTDPSKALDDMDKVSITPVPMGRGFRSAADAAVAYFHECINKSVQPS